MQFPLIMPRHVAWLNFNEPNFMHDWWADLDIDTDNDKQTLQMKY